MDSDKPISAILFAIKFSVSIVKLKYELADFIILTTSAFNGIVDWFHRISQHRIRFPRISMMPIFFNLKLFANSREPTSATVGSGKTLSAGVGNIVARVARQHSNAVKKRWLCDPGDDNNWFINLNLFIEPSVLFSG